jgi:hypothetical protein
MTFTSLIIVLFIFIMAGLVILRPFLIQTDPKINRGSGLYDSLLAERERLLSSIEELDLDLELKKISASEHTLDRDALLVQAAEVLRELDKYSKPKKTKKTAGAAGGEDELEKMIADRRRKLKDTKTVPCIKCGKPLVKGDQFCSHCGAKQ